MATDQLSTTFAALADPTRRAILSRLAAGETTVTELARPFAISLPAVTKHLKVLERAGLIAQGRRAQWRPCRLQARPMREVADWVQQYRRFWEESLDRLEVYLGKLQAQKRNMAAKKNRPTKPLPPANPAAAEHELVFTRILQRAVRTGVPDVDRSGELGALVGRPPRFHAACLRNGRAARRRLPHRNTQSRRGHVRADRRLPRDRTAPAARLYRSLSGRGTLSSRG